MAWIEVHTSLAHHYKLWRLAEALQISRAEAVGHLVLLWTWCIDHAEDGSLQHLTTKELAEIAGYSGDGQTLLTTLTITGFVDQEENDVTLHNWYEYTGRLLTAREANRTRQTALRSRRKLQQTPEPLLDDPSQLPR